MPAINAADTQRVARPVLRDTSCMPEAYAAVAEQRCSGVHTCAAAVRPCPVADREGFAGEDFTRSTHVHKRTDSGLSPWNDRDTPREDSIAANCMLFIVALVIASIAIVIRPRMRVPGGVNGAHLGWMSEQWLAEHRASHAQ